MARTHTKRRQSKAEDTHHNLANDPTGGGHERGAASRHTKAGERGGGRGGEGEGSQAMPHQTHKAALTQTKGRQSREEDTHHNLTKDPSGGGHERGAASLTRKRGRGGEGRGGEGEGSQATPHKAPKAARNLPRGRLSGEEATYHSLTTDLTGGGQERGAASPHTTAGERGGGEKGGRGGEPSHATRDAHGGPHTGEKETKQSRRPTPQPHQKPNRGRPRARGRLLLHASGGEGGREEGRKGRGAKPSHTGRMRRHAPCRGED